MACCYIALIVNFDEALGVYRASIIVTERHVIPWAGVPLVEPNSIVALLITYM